MCFVDFFSEMFSYFMGISVLQTSTVLKVILSPLAIAVVWLAPKGSFIEFSAYYIARLTGVEEAMLIKLIKSYTVL